MRARWNRHGLGHIAAQGSLLTVDSTGVPGQRDQARRGRRRRHRPALQHHDDEAETRVDLTPLRGDVSMVNLNEEHIADVPRIEGQVFVTARPNEIITLRFRRAE